MHGPAAGAILMTDTMGTHGLTAGQLARQATGGDLDAFEELVRRFQRRVHGFAYQHLRDADEAHDLAQEIFIKLFRNLARYDAERPFEPWFWKLAANTTINYRRRRIPLPVEPGDAEGDALGASAHGASAAAVAADNPYAHDPSLVDALAQLDPAYRLPVLLHYYADLSIEDVGLTLNLSVAAIKSRLHRARAQLRNALAETDETSPPPGAEQHP